MPTTAHFKPALFRFFKELEANNDREWFKANRDRYERDVRDPLTQFVLDFGAPLRRISGNFVADPRRSIFRIHRDTRFAKDKSPYKTHAAARFPHVRGRDVHTPGFYLHLEPGNVIVATGIWRPDSDSLKKIRSAIVDEAPRWKRIVNAKKFRETCTLEGDTLARPSRGFDPDHPLVDDLKRKDFIAVTRFTQKDACGSDFLGRVTQTCRASVPFVRFLTEALRLDW